MPGHDPLQLNGQSAASFDLPTYIRQWPGYVLASAHGRRYLTERNPLLFAILYLANHVKDKNKEDAAITFAQCHFEWCELALNWMESTAHDPTGDRRAIIAPRETGKSTWWFLILPMWAAAHGHIKFVSAFSGAARQAEAHLKSFKHELDTNVALRNDFPDLCKTRRKYGTGASVADNVSMHLTKSGFAFSAKGLDTSVLGQKVDDVRPDLLILDDIEPGESNYSAAEVQKRLITVRDDIMPLGFGAHLVWPGYTTMVDSLVHQMVRSAQGLETSDWIKALNMKVHYQPPVVEGESFWPQRWSTEFLQSEKETNPHGYAKNYENDPLDNAGSWWRREDMKIATSPNGYDRTVLVVDGAVTTKSTSDFTGLSVVGLDVRGRSFYVREAIGVKQAGEDLRSTVLELIEQYDVSYIMVETNQGGDMWHIVFHDMPVKVVSVHQKARKEFRIKQLLISYQRDGGRVFHEKALPQLERQELAYPMVVNDDIVDATACAVEHLTLMLLKATGRTQQQASIVQKSWVR